MTILQKRVLMALVAAAVALAGTACGQSQRSAADHPGAQAHKSKKAPAGMSTLRTTIYFPDGG